MKKAIFAAATLLVLSAVGQAQAGVDFRVNVGIPAPAVVAQPYPVAVAPVAVAAAPRFIYSPDLGYYVSTGSPDVVFVDNCYYRYSGGAWYATTAYGGPWSPVPRHRVPYALRSHSFQQVRYYRDHEYRRFQHDGDRYRGRWFTPQAVERVEYRHDRDHDRRWDRDGRWDHDGRWDRR